MRGIAEIQHEYTEAIADLKSDLNWLKEMAILAPAERRFQVIALDMGLEPVRLLDPGEIYRMTMTEAAQEFDQSDLERFRNCDLIIAAQSPSEGDCYITVQVSYTVDHSDINSAVKHAEMVTRFTGRPAFAAVSGVERAAVTEGRLSTDAAHMHRLPRRSTQPHWYDGFSGRHLFRNHVYAHSVQIILRRP